jgi:hypothetical protein
MTSCIFRQSAAHILRNENVICFPPVQVFTEQLALSNKLNVICFIYFHDVCEAAFSTIHMDGTKLCYVTYIFRVLFASDDILSI